MNRVDTAYVAWKAALNSYNQLMTLSGNVEIKDEDLAAAKRLEEVTHQIYLDELKKVSASNVKAVGE